MTREDVKNRLDEWADSGLLCSKRGTGFDYTAIKRMIGTGELYATSYENIVARSEDVRDEFEKYVKEGQIMSRDGPYRSDYRLSYQSGVCRRRVAEIRQAG